MVTDVVRSERLPLDRQESMLLQYFEDPCVDELLINGAQHFFVRIAGSLKSVEPVFESDSEFFDFLIDFAAARQTRLDPLCGSAGGVIEELPGRWHCILPPLSQDGPVLAIRRHRFLSLGLDDFIICKGMRLDLEAHLARRDPLIIAGETGSGKTTLLAALLQRYAADERVIIIETIPELPRLYPGWVRLSERPQRLDGRGVVNSERLLAEALRLSPDRLVFGEIRGTEARWFIEATRTGHTGLVATLHSGGAAQANERLWALANLEGTFERVGIAVLRRELKPRMIEFKLYH